MTIDSAATAEARGAAAKVVRIIAIFQCAGYGWGMVSQPDRFHRTPAYGDLLSVLSIQAWGILYLLAATLLTTWHRKATPQWWGALVHGFAIVLAGGWLLAFVYRWLSDQSTTDINLVNWAALVSLLVFSYRGIFRKVTK